MNDFDKFDKYFLIGTVFIALIGLGIFAYWLGSSFNEVVEAQGEINKGLDLGE